jgi:hypothetical protein
MVAGSSGGMRGLGVGVSPVGFPTAACIRFAKRKAGMQRITALSVAIIIIHQNNPNFPASKLLKKSRSYF